MEDEDDDDDESVESDRCRYLSTLFTDMFSADRYMCGTTDEANTQFADSVSRQASWNVVILVRKLRR